MKRSIVCIHFGVAGPASPRGQSRHCLTATISASTPSTIFSQLTQVAGWPESLALAPLETSSATVRRVRVPRSSRAPKAGPLRRARGVASIEHDRDDRQRADGHANRERQDLTDRLAQSACDPRRGGGAGAIACQADRSPVAGRGSSVDVADGARAGVLVLRPAGAYCATPVWCPGDPRA